MINKGTDYDVIELKGTMNLTSSILKPLNRSNTISF